MSLKPGVNPYHVLGLERGCTEKEITKGYRLQCLKWHPDKNLNNKDEAERRFIAAKEAFEFLFDKTKRQEYDRGEERVRVAEEKHRARMEKADGVRKKLIEDLNKREKEFASKITSSAGGSAAVGVPVNPVHEARKRKNEELRMRSEIEEIRKQLEKEANEEVQRQMERVRQAHAKHSAASATVTPKLLVKWKPTADEDYSEDALRILFEPYGKVANISRPLLKKDRRKCLIEFAMGENAWGAETETGLDPGPELSAKWINPPVDVRADDLSQNKTGKPNTKTDYNSMSLEDLEAQILGGLAEPVEKRTKKWFEE